MSIQKLAKHQGDIPYSMMSRDVIQEITNPDALAIWVFLQSKPDNWNVQETQIRNHFDLGRTRYMKAMRQLRELGLYEVVRLKDDSNNFTGSRFNVYCFPQVSKSTPIQNRTYIKEEENTKEKERVKEKEKQIPKPSDKPEDVSDQVWQDFKQLRKAKKAPITQTAMTRLRNESKKAGWTLDQALEETVSRGWQSFKADWVKNLTPPSQQVEQKPLDMSSSKFKY